MKGLVPKAKLYLKRSTPTILSCASVIGIVATTVTAIKATPKAVELVKANSRINHDGDPYASTKIEVIQSCWRCYIPTVLIGLSTITCILGINVLNKRNQASLTTAYGLLNESYQKYRKAANTVFGDNADSKIKVQMAKDAYVSADGYSVYSLEDDEEGERILCYDLYSQRYFVGTMAAVLNAQYHLNRNLSLRGYASVNEFYEFLGIDGIKYGDDIGWSYDQCVEEGILWLDFENSQTIMDDGMKCCVISALWEPTVYDADLDL